MYIAIVLASYIATIDRYYTIGLANTAMSMGVQNAISLLRVKYPTTPINCSSST